MGLDISPATLRAARIRATAQATQVRWCQASIAALPFAANAFDVLRNGYRECTRSQFEQFLLELGSDFAFVCATEALADRDPMVPGRLGLLPRRLRCLITADLKLGNSLTPMPAK